MHSTFLRWGQQTKESQLIIATNLFELIICKDEQVSAIVTDAHCDDITQLLALTDFEAQLTYVSLSFDGTIKFWSEDGHL